MKYLAYIFLFISICLFSTGFYQLWLHYAPNRLAVKQSTPQVTKDVNKKQMPKRIILTDVKIDLPVIPAKVTQNVWETTSNGASYLTSSPLPGEEGNSVIYGHNWASLFGNLEKVKPGQKVEIEFEDSTRKTFVIESTAVVNPDDSKILSPSHDNRLTLYTCTGWFDVKRFVAVAVLN